MPDEIAFLRKRMDELSARADSHCCYTRSEFLTLAEQDVVSRMALAVRPVLWGGYEGAERKIAVFGSTELCGYEAPDFLACVKIAPANAKFADVLTHRDFLGSLMALGVKRELLGDILIADGCGYLFCLESMADYLARNLIQVKRTAVSCFPTRPPDVATDLPEQTAVNVASERLDALIAAVFHLSRGLAQAYIAQEKVFLNSRLCLSPSADPKPGTIISVRGLGRFRYDGVDAATRKGRLRVLIRKY